MSKNIRPWATRFAATGLAATGVLLAGATGASAQEPTWTNCGDYICTTYYTRDATRDYLHELEDFDYYNHQGKSALCLGITGAVGGVAGVGGGPGGVAIGATAGVAAGSVVCGLFVGPEGSDLTDFVSDVVAQNACYQYEYPANDPNGQRTHGMTNDEGWCFD